MIKKRKSLAFKLFIMNGSLILLVILLSFTLNNLYLGKYHISRKKLELLDVANKLKTYSANDEFYAFADDVSSAKNLNILLYDDLANRGFFRMGNMRMMRGFNSNILEERERNRIENGEIITKLFKNPMMNINNLTAFVALKDSTIAVIINSGLLINESTTIAREFYIIIAPFTLLISLIASYFFTRKITTPINKLNNIAVKMADMDFSEKFDLKTGDEIETLGETFNYLSNQLELNISNLNSVAEQLKVELSQEKKLDKKRTEFISNVSHELKTPIALINAYAEGLIDKIPTEQDIDYYYETILNEGQKMDKLVKELLNYMNLKDERLTPVTEEIEIIAIIDKVINKFSLDYKKKNIKVNFEKNDISNTYVKCSILKFEQILDNLMSNAITHVNFDGNINISILDLNNSTYKVSIFNSGSTISEENIKNIWEPFFKVDKARERKYGGIGLGLSIVKEIFDLYNFDFGVTSDENGTEFFFSFSKALS